MKRAAVAVFSLVMMLVATTVQADPYGTAGCGLGSMIFGDEKGIVQIFAATTNGSSGTQTFGITTGTSNCADSGGGTDSAKAFIETNREAFSKDVARGQGETITNLSALAGCADPRAVGSTLQSSFEAIFPQGDSADTEVSRAVIDTLKAHPELACGLLG
ncbi:MAG: DUF3015 family protein [Myxococcales bacterium]|nr:DUF3015 family protein [Myxococcales bacterium]